MGLSPFAPRGMSNAAIGQGLAFKGEIHPPVQGTGLTGSTWPETRPCRGGLGVSKEFARPPCAVTWLPGVLAF